MDNFNELVDEHVKWISGIGADPTGGTTRLLYDEHWRTAQKGLKDKFEAIDLVTSFDEVGNLYGKLEGTKYPNETILTGSHVDTVPKLQH